MTVKQWYNSLPATKPADDLKTRLLCLYHTIARLGARVEGYSDLLIFDDCFAVGSLLNCSYDTIRVNITQLRKEGVIFTKKIDKRYYVKI